MSLCREGRSVAGHPAICLNGGRRVRWGGESHWRHKTADLAGGLSMCDWPSDADRNRLEWDSIMASPVIAIDEHGEPAIYDASTPPSAVARRVARWLANLGRALAWPPPRRLATTGAG